MNASRMAEAERSLTSVARKVLDVTPIAEPWTIGSIINELSRKGIRLDYDVVQGCLVSLRDDGLVREVEKNIYQRAQPKPLIVKAKPLRAVEPPAPEPDPEPPAPTEPLVDIGTLAVRMRAQAEVLMAMADELERVGLEFEARVEHANEDGAKLRQLQALLKSIGS